MPVTGGEERLIPVTQQEGGAPCDDDESRTCLTPEEGAPASCAIYKAQGDCGTLTSRRERPTLNGKRTLG